MVPASVQSNLNRPFWDVQSARHLGLGEIPKIPQQQGLFLNWCEYGQALLEGDPVVERGDVVLDRGLRDVGALMLGGATAPLDQPVGLVAGDLREPRIGPADGRSCVGGAPRAEQCFLRRFLSVLAVMEDPPRLVDAASAGGMPILGASLHYSKSGV